MRHSHAHPSLQEEQIQAEYKQKALQLHPDRNQDEAAIGEFQLLQEAREVLLDPEMRAKYDRWRRSGLAVPFKQYANIKSTVSEMRRDFFSYFVHVSEH